MVDVHDLVTMSQNSAESAKSPPCLLVGKCRQTGSITAAHGYPVRAFLVAQTVNNLPAMQETHFNSWVGKVRWRRKWPPTPVFLPGESHGPRSLVSYSPWGHKELDTTE